MCRISFGCCGRFTPAEIVSFAVAFLFVCIWVLTGHWLLMDGEFLLKHYHFVRPMSDSSLISDARHIRAQNNEVSFM